MIVFSIEASQMWFVSLYNKYCFSLVKKKWKLCENLVKTSHVHFIAKNPAQHTVEKTSVTVKPLLLLSFRAKRRNLILTTRLSRLRLAMTL